MVFRRGDLYLVWNPGRPGFTFDSLTGLASPDLDPARLGTAALRHFRPVLDEPLPPGLEQLLILKPPG